MYVGENKSCIKKMFYSEERESKRVLRLLSEISSKQRSSCKVTSDRGGWFSSENCPWLIMLTIDYYVMLHFKINARGILLLFIAINGKTIVFNFKDFINPFERNKDVSNIFLDL